MALFFAAGTYGFQAAVWSARAGWGGVVGALIGGVFYGTSMALVFRKLQKKYGGKDSAQAIGTAIKEGRLPEDAQAEVWIPLLERKQRSDRFMVWAAPIEFGLFAALETYLGITEPGIWFWWAAAAVFAVFAIWTPLSIVRRRPRIEALITDLQAP